MSFLDAYRLDFMVAGFQEVTATTLVGCRPEFIDFHDSGMRALLAKPTGCFRACGILLDLDYVSELGRVAVGHSHIRACVKLVGWTQPVCIVCAHLPHSGRPLHDLEDALQSMQEDLQFAVDRLMPLVLMGDLNVSLVDSVTDRSHLVRSTLDGLGLHHFSHCADPTRHPSPRRLDHIVYSASFLSSCEQVSADAHLPWVAECYRWDAKDGLGVDHVLVSHDLLVQVRVPVSGRRHVQFRPVGKYQVLGRDPLIRGTQDFHRHCRQDGFDSFQSLVHLASQSTRKTVRESYKDNALIKDLCRVRSVTADPAERCELSRNIFALRKECRKQWRQDLWRRAACGDWKARQALQRTCQKQGGLQHLISATGSVQCAVDSLQAFFASRFSGAPPLPLDALPWHSLMDSVEILPGLPEIHAHVLKLKPGKTTGITGMSNDFLHGVMQVPGGAEALQRALHDLLCFPERVQSVAFHGLVLLLAKVPVVTEPKHVRPIVLTKCLTKLAARIATARVVAAWPNQPEMMGGRSGGQVAEAVWIAKHMLMRSCMFRDQYVYLKVDVSAAFDSLQHAAVQGELVRYFHVSHATSARFLDFLITHQVLQFSALGKTWTQTMTRGCVQGGCHSPLLFSRVLANVCGRLRDQWLASGEEPPFLAGRSGLWSLWFVDDGIVCFRNMRQLGRLFPAFLDALRAVGLELNLSKSKLLGLSLPSVLPQCLEGVQVTSCTQFLGMPLAIVETDSDSTYSLMRRAAVAFFSNRKILIERAAPVDKRLFMFNALITSTVRWSIGALLPTCHNLRLVRVQCTTLLVWVLRLRGHPAWEDISQYAAIRHIAKIWGRCWWGFLWDVLLLQQHWKLVGHMLRSTSCLSRAFAAPQEVHGDAVRRRLRRYRTGPDPSGFSRVHRFLSRNDLQVEIASNRQIWDHWQDAWLSTFDVQRQTVGHNLFLWFLNHTWHGMQDVGKEFVMAAKRFLLDLVG